MPYQLDPNFIYMFARRGDIESTDSDIVGQRDGMIGYMDAQDWFGAPVYLSDFTLKRMFVAKCNRSFKGKLKDAVKQGKDKAGKDIPSIGFLDYASFTSLKDTNGNNINDPVSLIHSASICPVWDFTKESTSVIKDSKLKDWKKIKEVKDFHAISAGSYTIGAGADDYPTINGAAGFFADFTTPTDSISGVITSALSETAATYLNVTLTGTEEVCITSDTPHNGDPTAGHLISASATGSLIDIRNTGAVGNSGVNRLSHLNIRKIAGSNGLGINMAPHGSGPYITHMVHNCLLDGNGLGSTGVSLGTAKFQRQYNNVVWDWVNSGLSIGGADVDILVENNSVINCGAYSWEGGINFNDASGAIARNNTGYNNSQDFVKQLLTFGYNNSSSDTTAQDADWTGGGSGNITSAVFANDLITSGDTSSRFMDLIPNGPLDGAGISGGITERVTDSRGRTVPGPNGYSIGAATGSSTVTHPIGPFAYDDTYYSIGAYAVRETGPYSIGSHEIEDTSFILEMDNNVYGSTSLTSNVNLTLDINGTLTLAGAALVSGDLSILGGDIDMSGTVSGVGAISSDQITLTLPITTYVAGKSEIVADMNLSFPISGDVSGAGNISSDSNLNLIPEILMAGDANVNTIINFTFNISGYMAGDGSIIGGIRIPSLESTSTAAFRHLGLIGSIKRRDAMDTIRITGSGAAGALTGTPCMAYEIRNVQLDIPISDIGTNNPSVTLSGALTGSRTFYNNTDLTARFKPNEDITITTNFSGAAYSAVVNYLKVGDMTTYMQYDQSREGSGVIYNPTFWRFR